MVENAAVISSEPTLWPKVISTPLQMMVRAVRVQMTMVSAKTSKIPYRPCWTGLLVSAAAWAMAAEPRPASLEKALLRRPQTMVCFERNTTGRAAERLGRKGCGKDLAKGRADITGVTENHDKRKMMYKTLMTGTSFFRHGADALDAAEEDHADERRDRNAEK